MFKMTAWQEFKEIWDRDGWGQPRTVLSKIAVCFYLVYVALFIMGVMIHVEIIEPCYNAVKQFFKKSK
jgi:hypothetical protein